MRLLRNAPATTGTTSHCLGLVCIFPARCGTRTRTSPAWWIQSRTRLRTRTAVHLTIHFATTQHHTHTTPHMPHTPHTHIHAHTTLATLQLVVPTPRYRLHTVHGPHWTWVDVVVVYFVLPVILWFIDSPHTLHGSPFRLHDTHKLLILLILIYTHFLSYARITAHFRCLCHTTRRMRHSLHAPYWRCLAHACSSRTRAPSLPHRVLFLLHARLCCRFLPRAFLRALHTCTAPPHLLPRAPHTRLLSLSGCPGFVTRTCALRTAGNARTPAWSAAHSRSAHKTWRCACAAIAMPLYGGLWPFDIFRTVGPPTLYHRHTLPPANHTHTTYTRFYRFTYLSACLTYLCSPYAVPTAFHATTAHHLPHLASPLRTHTATALPLLPAPLYAGHTTATTRHLYSCLRS